MPKTGRPKLEPSARKAGFITLRMSDDERTLIDQAAQQEGKQSTTWAREQLITIAQTKFGSNVSNVAQM